MISIVLRNQEYVESFINTAQFLSKERVLLIDENDKMINEIKKKRMNLDINFCSSSDFRILTEHPESYMNAFDIILCPNCFFNLKVKNRKLFLPMIMWLMKPESRFIFTIPNLSNFLINKKFKLFNNYWIIKDEDEYFKVKNKNLIKNRGKKEYWHKNTCSYPLQPFKSINVLNENIQWKIDDCAIVDKTNYFIYSIDLIKKGISS